MTLHQKQVGLMGATLTIAIAMSIGSHELSPMLYVIFPGLAFIWVASTEQKLSAANDRMKKMPWRRKIVYYVIWPVLAVVGSLFGASGFHQAVPAPIFWIGMSLFHGIFIVKLYLSYVNARNKYGRI
jgi:hypothetical protein